MAKLYRAQVRGIKQRGASSHDPPVQHTGQRLKPL